MKICCYAHQAGTEDDDPLPLDECKAFDVGDDFYAKVIPDSTTAKQSIIYMVKGFDQTETGTEKVVPVPDDQDEQN